MSKRSVSDSNTDGSVKKSRSAAASSTSSSSSAVAAALPFTPQGFDATRGRVLTSHAALPPAPQGDCVVYWMSRDQRAVDNFALVYAKGIADARGVPLRVVFNLVPRYSEATIRQYGFMVKGLQETEQMLRSLGIPMHLTMGNPVENIPAFVQNHGALCLVTDFSPIRVPLQWTTAVAAALDALPAAQRVPLVQIDAHNVVPCWVASPKLEYGARTIRSKITKLFPQYFVDIPATSPNDPALDALSGCPAIDWPAALASLQIDRSVPEVTWLTPGYTGATQTMQTFIDTRLKDYSDKRNDPNEHVASNLSPYYHFGQISPHRVAMTVKALRRNPSGTDAFLEESIIRRELADNFCYYNPRYDDLDSCYDWAKESLAAHAADERDHLYTREQFERAQTHDDLWNASQLQMVREGITPRLLSVSSGEMNGL